MKPREFEEVLNHVAEQLTSECRSAPMENSRDFERRVREALDDNLRHLGLVIDFSPASDVFPDIAIGEFGVEVKFTQNNTWRSVANSILESTRNQEVRHIYVMYGKMGGVPEVRWGRYEESVIHVRTSHVPRFEVQIGASESLFTKFNLSYANFSALPIEDKMRYVRTYARERLRPGERLWWLEETPDQEHSLPMEVRMYMNLSQEEKRSLRAEAALLCPQIVKPSRHKKKYDDVALYLLTYRGVMCPQARDLFSAGSVAHRRSQERGGNYVARALQDIEEEMIRAATSLDDALFVEYWEMSVPPAERIVEWLRRADNFAKGWIPSDVLFKTKF